MECKMKCSTVRTDCIAIMITVMFFRCLRFALLGFGFTDNHTKLNYIIVKNFLIDILIAMVFVEITLFKDTPFISALKRGKSLSKVRK